MSKKRKCYGVIDTIVGLHQKHKEWLARYKNEFGVSNSAMIRKLIDNEIKRQDLHFRKIQKHNENSQISQNHNRLELLVIPEVDTKIKEIS